MSEIFL